MTQSQSSQAPREALTDAIIDAKIRKDLTFEQINEGSGLSLAFVTAALLGQHPLPADAAKVVAAKLDLGRQQCADRRPATPDVLFERLHQLQVQRLAGRVRSRLTCRWLLLRLAHVAPFDARRSPAP